MPERHIRTRYDHRGTSHGSSGRNTRHPSGGDLAYASRRVTRFTSGTSRPSDVRSSAWRSRPYPSASDGRYGEHKSTDVSALSQANTKVYRLCTRLLKSGWNSIDDETRAALITLRSPGGGPVKEGSSPEKLSRYCEALKRVQGLLPELLEPATASTGTGTAAEGQPSEVAVGLDEGSYATTMDEIKARQAAIVPLLETCVELGGREHDASDQFPVDHDGKTLTAGRILDQLIASRRPRTTTSTAGTGARKEDADDTRPDL